MTLRPRMYHPHKFFSGMILVRLLGDDVSLHCDPFRLNYSSAKFRMSTGMGLNGTLFEAKMRKTHADANANSEIVETKWIKVCTIHPFLVGEEG